MLGERLTLPNIAYDAVLGVVAGTGGLATHFMLFQPQFDAFNIAGIKGGALVDWIAGILSIVATYKWLGKTTWKIFGYILGGTLLGLGVFHQLNLFGAPAPALRAPTQLRIPIAPPPTPTRSAGF